jgi:hypothetical protein
MERIKSFNEFINESKINERMDTKYWADYNNDTSGQGNPAHQEMSKDFEDTFEEAVTTWNQEAERDSMIKTPQIKKIEKMAQEFYKIEKWISVNVIHAMIMQES